MAWYKLFLCKDAKAAQDMPKKELIAAVELFTVNCCLRRHLHVMGLMQPQRVDGVWKKTRLWPPYEGCLGILSSEMHFGWPSPSLPILTSGEYKVTATSEEASWLAVICLAGTVTGAILSGFLADILGRKKIILLTSVPFLLSWLLIGFASSVVEIFLGRYLGGTAGGICFSTVPMYLGEISEPQIRGMLSSLCPVSVVLGILVINALGNYLPIDTTAFIASSIPLVMFVTFIWMPESPIHLLKKSEFELAKKNLIILRGKEEGEKEFERLLLEKKSEDEEKENNTRILDLFTNKCTRRALIIGLGLRTIQQICGATAITFFCKTLFEQSKELMSPNVGTIIYFSLQAVLSIISSAIVDILGRRPMMIFSLTGTVLTLFLLTIYLFLKNNTEINMEQYGLIPMIALFANIVFFSLGVRNIPLLMISEMFPTNVKSKALCVATIYYGTLAITVTQFFYLTWEQFGMYFPFAIFGITSFLSLFFVYFFVPETKRKTLEDIQKDLMKSVKN